MWTDVNIFAVIGAAVASFVVGMLWYGPVFGKQWMAMMGYTPDSMRSMRLTPMQAMAGGAVSTLVLAYVTALFVTNMGTVTIGDGISLAFMIWLGFIATTVVGTFLWENRSPKLAAFNAVYHLVNMIVVTLVLTIWQ